MKKFKFMIHNSLMQRLRNIFLRNTQNDNDNAGKRPHIDLIEYTTTFARTKRKTWKNPINYNDQEYPRFNNADYDPEKLMYVYNTAVAARKSLAALEGFTVIKEMRDRINEINGNIYNIISALGKVMKRCEETNNEDTTNTAQNGED